jgi:hypothetical protein
MNIAEKRHYLKHSVLSWLRPQPEANDQEIEKLFALHEFCKDQQINVIAVDKCLLEVSLVGKVIARGVML